MLRFELHGPRPGSGVNWYLEVRDSEGGAITCHASGPRDVVLAAFVEYVEELHAADDGVPEGLRWRL